MEIKKRTSFKEKLKEAYVLLILVGTILILAFFSDGKFLSNASIINVLRVSVAPLVVATVATLLMITGNVDLSVGSIVGLVATVYAIMAQVGIPIIFSMLVVVCLGCACGWINGLLVTKLNITPVIVTLATMSLFLGIAKLLIPDGFDIIKNNMPEDMLMFAKGNVVGKIPPSIFVSIIIVGIFVFMQKKSTLGKYSVAIGGNKIAAQLAGINVQRAVWLLYVLVGAVSAVGGITRASYMQAGDPDVGFGLEVQVIIAILLGGAGRYDFQQKPFLGHTGRNNNAFSQAKSFAQFVCKHFVVHIRIFYLYLNNPVVFCLR